MGYLRDEGGGLCLQIANLFLLWELPHLQSFLLRALPFLLRSFGKARRHRFGIFVNGRVAALPSLKALPRVVGHIVVEHLQVYLEEPRRALWPPLGCVTNCLVVLEQEVGRAAPVVPLRLVLFEELQNCLLLVSRNIPLSRLLGIEG